MGRRRKEKTLIPWPPIDLHDPEAVKQRISEYFEFCATSGEQLGNMGLYAALGLTRQDVHDVLHGKNKSKVSRETIDILKKGKLILGEYRETLLNMGLVSPKMGIFMATFYDGVKNNDGD